MELIDTIYKDGVFVPEHDFGSDKEGRRFKFLIVEEGVDEFAKDKFFQFVDQYSFNLPEDYKFDRDEIYER